MADPPSYLCLEPPPIWLFKLLGLIVGHHSEHIALVPLDNIWSAVGKPKPYRMKVESYERQID